MLIGSLSNDNPSQALSQNRMIVAMSLLHSADPTPPGEDPEEYEWVAVQFDIRTYYPQTPRPPNLPPTYGCLPPELVEHRHKHFPAPVVRLRTMLYGEGPAGDYANRHLFGKLKQQGWRRFRRKRMECMILKTSASLCLRR